jgi:acetolactate synthase-1/2/3 large subunit
LTGLRKQYPFTIPGGETISPQFAIALLSDVTGGEAIISLGVGQHQMWAMQHYRSRRTRSFLSSSGFGTMGYGLPAAIGAKVACPDRQVIDIDGDGSLNMTIQELATCHRFGIGVKVVVINNQWLGMVRQWQDMIYDKHRSGSDMSDPMAVKPAGEEDIYPNFLKIAEGYRVEAERVTRPEDLEAAFQRMLADPDEPWLLDVIVAAEENVYPMIPAGGSYKDIIMSEEDLVEVSRDTQGSNI